MKRLVYYANGGCGNHGCEAIIRSLETILKTDSRSLNLSNAVQEDSKYGLDELVDVCDIRNGKFSMLDFFSSYINLKILNNKHALDLCPYKRVLRKLNNKKNLLALSVGGDNYCYGANDFYAKLNRMVRKKGISTAMVGCSIEPESLSESVISDLSKHKVIVARENITFKALKSSGLANVEILPDPAFALKTINGPLPDNFKEGNTVGINFSPTVIAYGKGDGVLERNVEILIESILTKTDMNIAFIPHVVWGVTDDRSVMDPLYEKYKHTNRVCRIHDCPAEELKGYISRCRFFITARTHASIAAYSTCVPTLVIGYSVKARGIAEDIFGTSENYVLETQNISNDNTLLDTFDWLRRYENKIITHLQSFMPNYIARLEKLADLLQL